jgi:oligoribonuclease NrnB/cAMP/cGMP phosphodiesterase (DHH superfamily)
MRTIFYHDNCADGFMACCIARAYHNEHGLASMIRPINYDHPISIEGLAGEDVIFLDYTPSAEVLTELSWLASEVLVIDHHKTAETRNGPDAKHQKRFDLTKSGAELTWQHYHQNEPLPTIVRLVSHRDLGKAWQEPEHPDSIPSLNLHAYLMRCLPRFINPWTQMLNDPEPLAESLAIGAKLRLADADIIAAAVERPHLLTMDGEIVPAVNGLSAELVSDACNALLLRYPSAPFACSWFIASTGRVTYSLRSRKGGFNVAEFAAKMSPGGGGHPCAAGFSTLIPLPIL